MLDPKAFKAYDVRGLYPTELDEDGAYRIGRAYVEQFSPAQIAVGRDMRLSSPSMAEAVREGAADAGANVLDLGLVGTEMLYFAVGELGLDGGITVTASHNPKQYTGMKIVRARRAARRRRVGPARRARPGDRRRRGGEAARGEIREEDIWDAVRRTRALVRRRLGAAAAQGRDRCRERHGRRDAAARARAPADARRRPLLLRAGRHVPEPRAEPAAAGEPRVHRREDARASMPTSGSPSTATPTGASSSTTAESSSPATSSRRSSPSRSWRASPAAR